MMLSDLQKHSLKSVKSLQSYLKKNSLDAFFVADLSNVRYLTTFSGTSGFCLVFRDTAYFLTDFRYKTQANRQVASCEVLVYSGNVFEFLQKKLFRRTQGKGSSVGVEDSLPVGTFDEAAAKISSCSFTKTSLVIEKLAAVKSKPEIDRIKSACSISADALDVLTHEDWLGKRERDLSATLEFNQKVLGAAKESFDTIVASGLRGAMPHGVASDKVVERDEFVTIDFGCFYDGYASDITRTFQTGERVKPNLLRIYQIVYDAQRTGRDAARAGVPAKKVDRAARDYIERKGYGKYFGHGLGHGVGLRIHELPRVSKVSEDVLEEGNIITIEPGIYVPKSGGVRIEDDFLVTKEGVEQLTHFSKDRDYYISTYGK
ncbi:MAG: aminopeptidase P family protein [Bacteroidetes bacterium]|nr:aminopeptidase P family protein [Bacteroidota bacterium]